MRHKQLWLWIYFRLIRVQPCLSWIISYDWLGYVELVYLVKLELHTTDRAMKAYVHVFMLVFITHWSTKQRNSTAVFAFCVLSIYTLCNWLFCIQSLGIQHNIVVADICWELDQVIVIQSVGVFSRSDTLIAFTQWLHHSSDSNNLSGTSHQGRIQPVRLRGRRFQ